MNRFKYEVVFQVTYGYGWDDVWSFDTKSQYVLSKEDKAELIRLKKEHAKEGVTSRTIRRRSKND